MQNKLIRALRFKYATINKSTTIHNKAFIDTTVGPGIATPPEEDRATATADLHTKKFVKIGPAVPDRQTHRQTNKLIAILRSATGAE